MSRPTVYYKDDNEHNIHTEQAQDRGQRALAEHVDDSYGACSICREYVPNTDDETVLVSWPCAVVRLERLQRIEAVARRLERAIVDRAAVRGMGWKREMDADQEHLAALKALRAALATDGAETP